MDFRKPASRILFIGHRGFPALAPENTLPSFERALDAGCDAIECDVRITKDGHFVVMHDETPARTTDAAERFPGENPRVSDLTFSEIRQLDAGSWFAGQDPFGSIADSRLSRKEAEAYRGAAVPELSEVFELVRKRGCYLVLELKDQAGLPWDGSAVEDCVARIREAGLTDRTLFASFSRAYLKRACAACPELATGLLAGVRPNNPIDDCLGCHAACYMPRPEAVMGCDLHCMRFAKIPVNMWTINDPAKALQQSILGVNGFYTDDPEKLTALFPDRPPLR